MVFLDGEKNMGKVILGHRCLGFSFVSSWSCFHTSSWIWLLCNVLFMTVFMGHSSASRGLVA